MNKNAKLWVEALRSRMYKQGRGSLVFDGQHCVLGVACDIAAEAGIARKAEIDSKGYGGFYASYIPLPMYMHRENTKLPAMVRDWLGLTTRDGRCMLNLKQAHDVRVLPGLTSLAILNDRHRISLEHLADLIAQEPLGLFMLPKIGCAA